ncbi:glutathione peroxidase [Hyaloraphidium curvatum]|nr:glutathione peroxidase [Hyaloraphidium curvatum]
MSDLTSIPLKTINGKDDSLANHEKVLLVVNVASKCGLTPQYKGLESLYNKYKAQGFEVLGFPANDFGAQEPGTHGEIIEFCKKNYGVSFPLFEKQDVTGEGKQPLYKALIDAKPEKVGPAEEFRTALKGYGINPTADPEILWWVPAPVWPDPKLICWNRNFEKFLVKDGKVVERFAPNVAPEDPILVEAVEAALAA